MTMDLILCVHFLLVSFALMPAHLNHTIYLEFMLISFKPLKSFQTEKSLSTLKMKIANFPMNVFELCMIRLSMSTAAARERECFISSYL